jgi:hypothetical protein
MHTEPVAQTIARDVRIRRGALVMLAALGCAALIGACGSSSTSSSSTPAGSALLNTRQTKESIEETLLRKRHLHATVTCPAEVEKRAGVTFVCIATTATGVKTPFHVTVKSNRGFVEYKSP